MSDYTTKEIVAYLDEVIIGQEEAKRAIATAIVNRQRRMKLSAKDKKYVGVDNILMVGPTGTSKTEMFRVIADKCNMPLLKIDATGVTASGYVGNELSTLLSRLVSIAEKPYSKHIKSLRSKKDGIVITKGFIKAFFNARREQTSKATHQSINAFETAYVEFIESGRFKLNYTILTMPNNNGVFTKTPVKINKDLSEYKDIQISLLGLACGLWSASYNFAALGLIEPKGDRLSAVHATIIDGVMNGQTSFNDFITHVNKDVPYTAFDSEQRSVFSKKCKYDVLKMGTMTYDANIAKSVKLPKELKTIRDYINNYSIVFIDEIDKLIPVKSGSNDIGTVAVQYELLKIIEGADVQLTSVGRNSEDLGHVNTENILFVCAGSFASASVDGLIPELRGRLPIEVNLKSLTETDLCDILNKSAKSPLKAAINILKSDKINLTFTKGAVSAIARFTAIYNKEDVDLGARRLNTTMNIVMAPFNYEIMAGTSKIVVTETTVTESVREFYEKNYHLYELKDMNYSPLEWAEYIRVSPNSPVRVENIRHIFDGANKEHKLTAYRVLGVCVHLLFSNSVDAKTHVRNVFSKLYASNKPLGELPKYIKDNIIEFIPKDNNVNLLTPPEIAAQKVIEELIKG